MAKYYVESGDFRTIVQAEDAQAAAVWAMHLALEEQLPLDEIDWLSNEQREDRAFADSMGRFAQTVRLSQIGFGRDDAGEWSTLEIMIEWNQLATAIARLEQLVAAH